jgi:hypothetical protein
MLEVSFRQIFVFNEEASLQAASATCRHATGRCFRGVVSSGFWRFFECGRVLWGFYTEFEGLLSCSQNENFLLGERLSFPSLRFPVSFLRSLLLLSFSDSPLWVYFGQSGFFESVVQVVFCRGV